MNFIKSIRTIFENINLNKSTLNLIFIPTILFILIISFLSYRQVNNLIQANHLVVHTYEVIQEIDASMYNMLEMESDQRAYLITNDNRYIDDFVMLKSRLKENLKRLELLTQDNIEQHKRVFNFVDLIEQRLTGLTQIIQLKSSDKLNTPEGMGLFTRNQDLSNRVKNLASEIKSVEHVLLEERNQALIRNVTSTSPILIAGSTISILVLLFAFALVNSQLTKRIKSEINRREIELRLRSILESASDMIAALDKDYKFIIFNDAYQREFKFLFGRAAIIGQSLDDILSDAPETKQKILKGWRDSLEGVEYIKNIEFNIDGERVIYEVNSSTMKDENNEIVGAVHIIRNITNRMKEQIALQESYEKLDQAMHALQDKNDQITLLVEMSDIMLACSSQEELREVMTNYCKRILKFADGYLYVMHPSKNYLEMTTSWGKPHDQEATFPPDSCWAIRLGRMHLSGRDNNGLLCPHIKSDSDQNFFCVCKPLMAQNDIYGLLYLEVTQEEDLVFTDNQKLLINAFAELIALALANVRLRENLRYQSIRDPLTGLYNRRYLEDFLFKQIHQSDRTNSPLSVLMLDLDHFKKINDTYGHDAGDSVLKELGKILENDIRIGDLAARYGGEEFIIVFYNTDIETAKQRAETIRNAVSMLQIKFGAQHVGPITISIGIASYPENGKNAAELIESADKALYTAKNSGRNKVILASDKDYISIK